MPWDVFGHIPQLPQLLQGCGFQAVVFTRSNYREPSISIPGMNNLFVWTGPEGSQVYARRISYIAPFDPTDREKLAEELEKNKESFPALLAELLLDTNDMMPPRIQQVGQCKDSMQSDPSVIFTGTAATKYFSHIDTLVRGKKLRLTPVTRDMSQYNEGCELSRIDLKIANRLVENSIYELEMWSTIASQYGIPFPSKELDYGWRQLMFCQHHDAVTGCNSEVAFIDVLDIYHRTLENIEETKQQILAAFSELVNIPSKEDYFTYLLFNSLPWKRKGIARLWVELSQPVESLVLENYFGQVIPFEIEQVQLNPDESITKALLVWVQEDLTSAGYEKIGFLNEGDGLPFIARGEDQNYIENEFLRVEVDPSRGGGIVSLVDKESGKEFIQQDHALPANNVVNLIEGDGEEPAWRLITTGQKEYASDGEATVRHVEGPVSSRLIIQGQGPGPCSRTQEIILYRETPFIDALTILDHYTGRQTSPPGKESKRDLYLVTFPLDLPGSLPVLEDRFFAKAYRRSEQVFDYRSNLFQWESGHAMNSCYRWIDVSSTFLVRFVKEKEEQGSIAIGPSEIVTPENQYDDLRELLMRFLVRHGVTSTPRRDHDDPSPDRMYRLHSFCIGNMEENSYTKKLLEQNEKASAYYERCMKEFGFASLVLKDQDKKSQSNPVTVFIFAGKDHALTQHALEEMIQSTITHRWDCPADACFLPQMSFVEDYGFALLNRGTSLCSLEADGTLAMALMHTTPYPGTQTPWPFEFAEQKTHVFPYRIIPHRGDWRHAEIPRRAMEFNHEPRAILVKPKEGILPAKKSFISIEPSNILVSAIKPGGSPEAEYEAPPKERPLIARLYEAHGEESNLWLESTISIRGVKNLTLHEQPARSKREIFREDEFVRIVTHAHEILTLDLDLKPERVHTPSKPAAQKEKPPMVSRYWRLHEGAAPEGFMPISLSLRGEQTTNLDRSHAKIQRFDLVVVNNSLSKSREFEVEIETPSYWRVIPSKVPCKLQPGAYQITPLHLLFDQPIEDGYLKAKTRWQGSEMYDFLHFGQPPNPNISMTLTMESFNIHLQHEHPYTLQGYISLVSPVEVWPFDYVGVISLSSITPSRCYFTLPPKEEKTLSFPLSEVQNRFGISSEHHWLIIKLVTQYMIRYYHVRLDGEVSEGLGKEIHPPYDFYKEEAT